MTKRAIVLDANILVRAVLGQRGTAHRQLRFLPLHINDHRFAAALDEFKSRLEPMIAANRAG